MDAYVGLIERVVDQTQRRVFDDEKVPAAEKVVSLFEPHTDIIVKGGRATQYGHKINVSTGRSGLVLDVVVEAGNPADSTRCLPMLSRHVETFGEPPQRAAFDGGYASKQNLTDAKELGVEHVVFHKKCGLEPADMTPSSWIYGQLKRFRAGADGHFIPEAVFWAEPLQLARLGTFSGVRARGGVRAQPDTAGTFAVDLTSAGRFVPLQILSLLEDPQESYALSFYCRPPFASFCSDPEPSNRHFRVVPARFLIRPALRIHRVSPSLPTIASNRGFPDRN